MAKVILIAILSALAMAATARSLGGESRGFAPATSLVAVNRVDWASVPEAGSTRIAMRRRDDVETGSGPWISLPHGGHSGVVSRFREPVALTTAAVSASRPQLRFQRQWRERPEGPDGRRTRPLRPARMWLNKKRP
jgi:hypothetical protein